MYRSCFHKTAPNDRNSLALPQLGQGAATSLTLRIWSCAFPYLRGGCYDRARYRSGPLRGIGR
jgi:hypothetical protein